MSDGYCSASEVKNQTNRKKKTKTNPNPTKQKTTTPHTTEKTKTNKQTTPPPKKPQQNQTRNLNHHKSIRIISNLRLSAILPSSCKKSASLLINFTFNLPDLRACCKKHTCEMPSSPL